MANCHNDVDSLGRCDARGFCTMKAVIAPDRIRRCSRMIYASLAHNRIVDHVEPRKEAMQDGPKDRFIHRPGYRDSERCTKADAGSKDIALVHIYAPVEHDCLLALFLSDRPMEAKRILRKLACGAAPSYAYVYGQRWCKAGWPVA